MDTTKLEYTAEELIAHKLQMFDLLVAKPKFDRDGADLLAFMEFDDGVKFCRIQCKGRSLKNSNHSNISIPENYVTPSFVVFLFVDDGSFESNNLYCFFASDITQWKRSEGKYILNINKNTFFKKLDFYKFGSEKIELIKSVITAAEIHGEFRNIVYSRGNAVCGDATVSGSGIILRKRN